MLNKSRQNSTAYNVTQDRSLTVGGEARTILNFNDSPLSGQITLQSSDEEIVGKALEAAKDLTAASNKIASEVTSATRDFIESASGQKSFLWIVAIAAVAFLFLFRRRL